MLPLLALLTSAAVGAVPPLEASLAWSPRRARLVVDGGPGEHLAEDAPATVVVSWGQQRVAVETFGHSLATDGVVLAPVSGEVNIQVSAVSCEDGGTRCVPVETAFLATVSSRRGDRDLEPVAVAPADAAQPPAAHAPTLSAALDQARLAEKLVLIDFTAVWCPPCNLMAAEVLHDPDDAAALGDFVLVEIDVDRQESWPTKDRYGVGGYPTLLAARPDGTEVDRMVGYPGEDALKAWLSSLSTLPALGDLPAADSLDPAQAAALAVRLERAGRHDEALSTLEAARAAGADVTVAALVVQEEPQAALATLEAAAAPGPWLWDAFSVAQSDPAVAAALASAVDRWLPNADPVQAADLLYVRGALAPEADAPVWFARAASRLWLGLSGDPALDRGHWVGLADLYFKAGDPDGALTLLERAVGHYPREFTFHYAHARTLLAAHRPQEAVAAARLAVEHGFGDNLLRAQNVLAKALHASGDGAAARALVEEALAAAPRPDDGTKVRTMRYVRALEDTRAALAPQGP